MASTSASVSRSVSSYLYLYAVICLTRERCTTVQAVGDPPHQYMYYTRSSATAFRKLCYSCRYYSTYRYGTFGHKLAISYTVL